MDWFRSWNGAPSDTKLTLVSKHSGVPRAIVTAIWWEILDYASQNTPRGSVKGIDFEIIAEQQQIDVTQCNACNASFRYRGMIDKNDTLSGWDRRQPKREDDSRARVDKYREKQRVTQRNAHVTQCNAPEEIRGDKIREEKPLTPLGLDVGFFEKCFITITAKYSNLTSANTHEINLWQKMGADFDRHVIPAIEEVLSQPTSRPSSFKYFTSVIERVMAEEKIRKKLNGMPSVAGG